MESKGADDLAAGAGRKAGPRQCKDELTMRVSSRMGNLLEVP